MRQRLTIWLAVALLIAVPFTVGGCSKKRPATATPQPRPTQTPTPTQGTPIPRITVVPKATANSTTAAETGASQASPALPRPTNDTTRPPTDAPPSPSPPAEGEATATPSATTSPTASPIPASATPPDSPLPTPGSTDLSSAEATPTSPAETPSPSPPPEGDISPPPIAGWSFQAPGFYLDGERAILYLSGVAVNTSDQTQQIDDFSLVVYDETEEAIANQGDAYVESPVWLVPPQFKAPFLITVYLPEESQVGGYELDIESRPASSDSAPDVDVVDVDWWAEEETGYTIEGKFENSNELSEFIQIVAMLYDEEGTLVAIGELLDQEKFLYADAYSFAIDRENVVAAPLGQPAVELEMQIVGR